MTRLSVWHGVLAAGLFFTAFSNVHAAVPTSGQLQFSVMREGDKIGTHRIEFKQGADELAVDIETDIAVKVLGIAFYRFEHEGHEIWRQNRLVSINSETNDDGTPHNLAAIANANALMIDGDARQAPEKPTIIPASLWNNDLITQTELLNTLDGSNMPITVTEMGQEIVLVAGRNVSATHYSVTGNLNRELWYDKDGVLVKVQFAGADGSEITYILE